MPAYAIMVCRMNTPTKTKSALFVRVYFCQRVVVEASANLNMLSEDRDGKLLFSALV